MLSPIHGAFGCVNFSLLVFVSTGDTTEPPRPKRVKLATVWCEYVDRHAIVAAFKNTNRNLRSCDLQAEFVLREGLDCEPERS